MHHDLLESPVALTSMPETPSLECMYPVGKVSLSVFGDSPWLPDRSDEAATNPRVQQSKHAITAGMHTRGLCMRYSAIISVRHRSNSTALQLTISMAPD
jgi:hypothetical protein